MDTSTTPASESPTIDFLIAHLPNPEIVRLLKERDPDAITLLRQVNSDPTLTIQVTKQVVEELGLRVTDDDRAVEVLKEIKDLAVKSKREDLFPFIDSLISFAEADEGAEIDLEGIEQPFEILKFLQTNSRLRYLFETTVAHLLQTLM